MSVVSRPRNPAIGFTYTWKRKWNTNQKNGNHFLSSWTGDEFLEQRSQMNELNYTCKLMTSLVPRWLLLIRWSEIENPKEIFAASDEGEGLWFIMLALAFPLIFQNPPKATKTRRDENTHSICHNVGTGYSHEILCSPTPPLCKIKAKDFGSWKQRMSKSTTGRTRRHHPFDCSWDIHYINNLLYLREHSRGREIL